MTDELDSQSAVWSRNRRVLVRLILVVFLVSPFLTRPRPGGEQLAFLAAATAVLLTVIMLVVMPVRFEYRPDRGRNARAWLAATTGLSLAILAVGGLDWINALIITGACIGLLAPTARYAAVGAALCASAGLGVGLSKGAHYGVGLTIGLGTVLACFFAFAAARRNELVYRLRETRAELARMAVADERLRIARDLHDLLGHSLSLITLKAELAGRIVGTDPDRAAREIADLEAVARQSLGEVRAAVTSYRQPSLAAELAGARQMLAAAGMECAVHAPESFELPTETEALLAWTVREGATNVVRHSGARRVTITISVAEDEAVAEVADDGVGPAWDSGNGRGPGGPGPGSGQHSSGQHSSGQHSSGQHSSGQHSSGQHRPGQHRPAELGSGLAGLAERARAVGAEISAGEGRGGKGFRLRVRVPTGQFSVS